MNKHTWTLVAGGHPLVVERLSDGSIMSSWGDKEIGHASHEQVLGAEILRLAEENAAQRLRLEEHAAVISTLEDALRSRVQEIAEGILAARERGRGPGLPIDFRDAIIETLEAENRRLREANVRMAADCSHPNMIRTQEGPLEA